MSQNETMDQARRTSQEFDLLVIGAGPGGYEAALEAARLGKKTALVERDRLGGTCLNRGCIPTKTLMHSVHLLEEFQTCRDLGIQLPDASGGQVRGDFGAMQERKNQVVGQLGEGIRKQLKAAKVTLLEGSAVLKGEGLAEVRMTNPADGVQSISAEHILIATGSVPALPPIPGRDLEGVITSDEILDGEGCSFKHLIIIGGGVIGVEMASIYRGLGCQVTILEGMKQILPNLELELSRSAAMLLKKKGIQIHTSAMVQEISGASQNADVQGEAPGEAGGNVQGMLQVTFEEKGTIQSVCGDGVLIATGRRANTEGLFDGEPLVETVKGAIKVDENFQTSLPGVYAIGDVVSGNVQLAHVATAQGIYVVRKLFGGSPLQDLSLIPSCIYTSPEIASVGMSLEQAKAAGISAKEHKCLLTANGKSLITREERSFMKVIYEEESQRILGAVMMCARATDMISQFSLAIHQGLTLSDMASIIRPHPTYEEGITAAVTL